MTTNLAFNDQAEYKFQNGSMFLQGQRGLIDSVHRQDETVFNRFKLLKKQDWDENEFPLIDARQDFLKYPKEGEMMKNNIGWQWAGDSTAANAIVPMVAPFQPSSDAWLWFMRQGDNEGLHSLSYSECVKISVPDGMNEIQRIHRDNDTMRRVKYVSEVFNHVIRTGYRIGLGDIDYRSEEASDALMLMAGAILILERGQFMPSFANTAALFFAHKFTPICETVRKIAVDEWNTHIPQIKYIIQHELKFPERRASLERVKPILTKLLEEVISNEVTWNHRQFDIGGEQLGFTRSMGDDYAYYAGTDIANELGLTTYLKQVKKNPLPFMDMFFDLNRERKASMEMKGGNYITLNAVKDDGQTTFPTSDL